MLPLPVLPLVVLAEFPRLQGAPPGLVGLVPADGGGQGVVEAMSRLPSQRVELARVHRVAPVVAGAVADRANEAVGLLTEVQDAARERQVLQLVPAPDVVDLALRPLVEDQVERGA